jgi:hypothetical protein
MMQPDSPNYNSAAAVSMEEEMMGEEAYDNNYYPMRSPHFFKDDSPPPSSWLPRWENNSFAFVMTIFVIWVFQFQGA